MLLRATHLCYCYIAIRNKIPEIMRSCSCYYFWVIIFFISPYVFAEQQINVLKDSDVLLMITTNTNEETVSCEITIPNGTSYSVFPESTLPSFIRNMTSTFSASCAIKLPSVSPNLKGLYVLTINTTNGQEKNNTFLRVQESAKIWPTSLDKVYKDEDFFMKLDIDVPGLIECHVIYPNGSDSLDILLLQEDNPFQEGQCGLRVSNVNMSNSGLWTLYTVNSTQNSYVGKKKITVYDDAGVFVQTSLKLGSESSVAIYNTDLQSEISYCMARSIDGTLSELQNGVCSLPQSTITDNDARNYSFKLGLKGKMEEVESTLQVSVTPAEVSSEYKPIETSVNITNSGSLNILCRLWSTDRITDGEENKVSFCRFIRPDGTGLQVSEGVGNKLYSYFGDGMNTYYYKDCGLTVHSPTEVDHGTWKCYLYWKRKLRMGKVEVNAETNNTADAMQDIAVSGSSSVVLAYGAVNKALYCRADRELDYCWFLMPNGTHVVPSHDPQDLMSGLCSYGLRKVVFDYDGIWVCNLGIVGRQEGDLTYNISVRVTDSTLMAEAKEVKAVAGGNVTLRCVSVPAGKTLNYCRFVTPTSRGLSFSEAYREERIMDRYQQYGSPQERYNGIKVGQCSITISPVQPEDYGKWRCSGVIQGTVEEGFDYINLVSDEDAAKVISTAAICGIAVGGALIIAVAVTLVWWITRRRRPSRPDNQSNSGSDHSSEDTFQIREPSSAARSTTMAYLRAASRRYGSFRQQTSTPHQ